MQGASMSLLLVSRPRDRAAGLLLWKRRRKVEKLHDAGMTPRQIATTLGIPAHTVNRDMRRLRLPPRRVSVYVPPPAPAPAAWRPSAFGAALLDALRAAPCPMAAQWLVLQVGNPERFKKDLFNAHQTLRRLALRSLVVPIRVLSPRLTYWSLAERIPMSLEDALELLNRGVPFGDVYPHVEEMNRDPLKNWYCQRAGLPNLIAREAAHEIARTGVVVPVHSAPAESPTASLIAARSAGYTGDICSHCQGSRMIRAGACMRCEDCGQTTGCG
jgi:hypothetical protein